MNTKQDRQRHSKWLVLRSACSMCGSDITEEGWSVRKHVGIDSIRNFIKFVEKQFS